MRLVSGRRRRPERSQVKGPFVILGLQRLQESTTDSRTLPEHRHLLTYAFLRVASKRVRGTEILVLRTIKKKKKWMEWSLVELRERERTKPLPSHDSFSANLKALNLARCLLRHDAPPPKETFNEAEDSPGWCSRWRSGRRRRRLPPPNSSS